MEHHGLARGFVGAAIVAAIAIAGTARPVAADHGYWPVSGVNPAGVAGHATRSAVTERADYWGTGCTILPDDDADAGLDPYGHVLDADYGVAVVLAQIDGVPLAGPNGVTIFLAPKAGEFIWADADGDSVFKNQHEADAGDLFLCAKASLPPTDADPLELNADQGGGGLLRALLAALAIASGLAFLGRRPMRTRGE